MNLVIVIGRGHSGTRAISQTLCDSGVHMGGTLNESYDLIPAEQMYEACRLFARHVVHRGGLCWDFSALLAKPLEAEFERLVRTYLASVLESDAEWRGWKLPETTLALPWIVKMFPDAYYISWVRDPRDSIMGGHLTDDLSDFGVAYDRVDGIRQMRAISWKYQREIVAATSKPVRWIDVRFEDFVLDQQRTLRALEGFLGLDLVRIPVNPDAVGRWRHDPEQHDFTPFEDDLRQLGYTETAEPATNSKRRIM
jgi:hypothetical protein